MAAASGWWAARYSQQKKHAGSRALLNAAYGQGLNYLLNEESDKATDILVQMLAVDPDTVELHLALGSLFRRRGEVDRAIRVHRNLMDRSSLSKALRAQASLELGRDFLKAGLLDRAEQLFTGMLAAGAHETEVCRHLADLYQQEKEWEKAIAITQRLTPTDPATWKGRAAHYFCELGEVALQQRDIAAALGRAEQALAEDPGSVRALLLKGRCLETQGSWREAVEFYEQVEHQHPGLVLDLGDDIERCHARLGRTGAEPGRVQGGAELASGAAGVDAAAAPDASSQRPLRYRCEACGFASRKLFWQCPGCQCWNSVKPMTTGDEL